MNLIRKLVFNVATEDILNQASRRKDRCSGKGCIVATGERINIKDFFSQWD